MLWCPRMNHSGTTRTRETAEVFFTRRFPGTLEALGTVLDAAVAALRGRACISPKDEPCTRMCLEEALVNAIRHGNKGDTGAEVRLELETSGDACTIKVFDQGGGFCPDSITMPTPDQLGGRGVCLIRHYMDRVFYDQAQQCLAMTFRRKPPAEGDPAP